MQDDTAEYSFEPGRLDAQGGRVFEVVALSLEIGPEAIRVTTREGTLSDDQLRVPVDDIVAVDATRQTTYALRFETDETEYRVTNVTPNHGRIDDVLSYLREQITGQEAETETDDTTDDETDLDEWVWGGTDDEDEGQTEEYSAGERFTCPECGEPIELPGDLPLRQRDVNCPNCASNVGETPAEEEVVVVEQ